MRMTPLKIWRNSTNLIWEPVAFRDISWQVLGIYIYIYMPTHQWELCRRFDLVSLDVNLSIQFADQFILRMLLSVFIFKAMCVLELLLKMFIKASTI